VKYMCSLVRVVPRFSRARYGPSASSLSANVNDDSIMAFGIHARRSRK